MKKTIINDQYVTLGEMSVKQYKQGTKIVVEGLLKLNQYFDDITTIQTSCLRVEGVNIQSEAFGTEDHVVIYTFLADNLNISTELINKELIEG